MRLMNTVAPDQNMYFLAQGGEMGALIRAKDWSKSSLGSPEYWPQSLRTTLGIVLNSRHPMFLWWGPDLICFYNDAYRPSLGENGKHPSILGMRAEEAWSEIWTIIKPLIDQVISRGEATWSQDQLIPIFRNGKIEDVYWTFSYSPVKDESGEIAGVLVTCSETTENVLTRKKLEDSERKLEAEVHERTKELLSLNESLRKSENRYHLMVEEVQDYAILYLNREGIVENWNAGAEKIKGYKAAEIIGKNFSSFYTAEDKASNLPQKLLALAVETGRAKQEGWRVRKDGSRFWASVVITAVHNEKKEVIGFSKVTHDLTEKKKANDALRNNAKELEQKNEVLKKMNKELESFAYISSHDLQEPLRKIQTFATRIAEKELEHLSENGRDYFERMQLAAARMQTLIEDLLAYSRTNTSERKYQHTNLNKIVEEVKAELKEELQQKHATIDAGELCHANIIPFQFRQLLHNLISNSLKFSKPEQAPRIKINSEIGSGTRFGNSNLRPSATYCHISVSDNGIGFEEEYREKIFGLFQRLHGRTAFKGTGIGLAIVKKIVDNHNGVITANSQLNNGATFDIYIPA